jgi:cyclic beta-1,2-glucan synthetase
VGPYAHLLSNGRYRTIVTGAGAGGSMLGDIALTRWSGDGTLEADGFFLYIRDLDRNQTWSAGLQPVRLDPDSWRARSGPGRVELVRADDDIETRLDCCVAPHAEAEFRLLTLVNRSRRPRRLEVTSYAEVALNYPAADSAHPAFSKLFVQTEYLAAGQALLARRRPRSPEEAPLFFGHLLQTEGDTVQTVPEVETDRARFVGRGRSLADPAALRPGARLSGTVGNVLDPSLSIRRSVTLAPGATGRLVAILAAGGTRGSVATLLTPGTAAAAPAAFAAASRADAERLDAFGITPGERKQLPWLTGALVFGTARPVLDVELPSPSRLLPGDLRALGLSGSGPLIVARITGRTDCAAARSLARIAGYWRTCGAGVDLLILREPDTPELDLHEPRSKGAYGTTLVRGTSDLNADLRYLVSRVARLVVTGSLTPEVPAATTRESVAPVARSPAPSGREGTLPAGEKLEHFNGFGGFTGDGSEYVIRLRREPDGLRRPPLAWTNVIANEELGCLTSDSGAGYTWSGNSRENRVTPWSNDPVADPAGEALYLRDEDRRIFWSPTAGPAPGAGDYEVRHGFGYSRALHSGQELEQEVLTFVPRRDGVKLVRIRVANRSRSSRRLSLFAYAEWVLGVLRSDAARFVVTARDASTGALLAVNPFNGEFAARVAFAALLPPAGARPAEWTADRTRFLGPRGSTGTPAAVQEMRPLDGRVGEGLDPCAGFRAQMDLAPGAQAECVFLLGQAASRAEALTMVRRYQEPGSVDRALEQVRGFWRETLSRVQVETPAPAIDLMLNGWLAYQNLACRVWARSAFYQSGGAFGFRDQLQDAAALIYLDPELTRRQILLHAGHQFPEGDVLHWWHPPTGKGIRTRFSDDLLWLPYITAGYIRHTGDDTVLDAVAPFVSDRPLAEGEDEAFLFPATSGSADVYSHCCRALDRSLTRGAHGIPLIGTGDWNDGMNRVGREGKGESVWLGFFLYHILELFLPLCDRRGDTARVGRYRAYQAELRTALDTEGWDGSWYRRAWYDDGAPLGSAASDECRIDAIAQAWAVLSGAASPAKAEQALDSLERHLVSEPDGIIRLLTPAFDKTPHDPGYIKGYLPGVRENGGQYTHGALWAVRALAEAGRAERAAPLLEMLSPVSHGGTAEQVAIYQVEPYVIAADVYGVAPHLGRGGWTWYTGSAGWMFRVALESILGLTVRDGKRLELRPCVPDAWPGFTLRYRLPGTETSYRIVVRRGSGAQTVALLDGAALAIDSGAVQIPLAPDGRRHDVRVELCPDVGPRYRPRAAPLERITSE